MEMRIHKFCFDLLPLFEKYKNYNHINILQENLFQDPAWFI